MRKLLIAIFVLTLLGTGVYVINSRVVKQPPSPTNFEECAKLKGSRIQESYPQVCVTENGERFVQELTKEEKQKLIPPSPSAENRGEDGCLVTGCSGQICTDEDTITTCEWREEYTCYGSAACERQENGECGWTMTQELESCLEEKN